MIIALVIALVVLGLVAHMLLTGVALGGLRTMIQELRSPAFRSTHPHIRARDLDVGPRLAIYGMYGFWIVLSALVGALALAHWA
jgi:hypothetical protein